MGTGRRTVSSTPARAGAGEAPAADSSSRNATASETIRDTSRPLLDVGGQVSARVRAACSVSGELPASRAEGPAARMVRHGRQVQLDARRSHDAGRAVELVPVMLHEDEPVTSPGTAYRSPDRTVQFRPERFTHVAIFLYPSDNKSLTRDCPLVSVADRLPESGSLDRFDERGLRSAPSCVCRAPAAHRRGHGLTYPCAVAAASSSASLWAAFRSRTADDLMAPCAAQTHGRAHPRRRPGPMRRTIRIARSPRASVRVFSWREGNGCGRRLSEDAGCLRPS